MRAWRARIFGVLLALAHLVAVVPFSQSSAEFARARRALTGYVMDDSNIRTAVAAWLSHSAFGASAEATYGHISTWETGGVTDMSYLFCDSPTWYHSCYNSGASSFNEDIGAWDVSGVTTMYGMFSKASAFDQDISGWAVHNVKDMSFMFYKASAFDQNLGWCVDDGVNLNWAFYDTPCASTSCGVQLGVCSMTDSVIRRAVAAWFSNSAAAEAMYGHISTWATGGVTDMSELFSFASEFNEDIGGWAVDSVTDMSAMFAEAYAFNQDLSDWTLDSVTNLSGMFESASEFNQDLGWCLAILANADGAFAKCKCKATSCGVAQKDLIGICEPFGMCLIGNGAQCYINSPTLIIIIVLALFAGVGRYVHKRKNADETYAAAARRVLCRRGTKVRAVAPTTSGEAAEQSRDEPALPASMVSVVDAPAAGIAPGELGTVVSVKHNPPAN